MKLSMSFHKHFLRFAKVMLLLLMLSPLHAFGQSKITGTVVDQTNGEPIIGATVKIKGTSTGVVTDIDGNYSIDVKPG